MKPAEPRRRRPRRGTLLLEPTREHIARAQQPQAPEALVEPVRIIRNIVKQSGFEQGDPQPFIECVQTIFPLQGTPTPVSPGKVIELEVPDMYGRPWAHIWERYWEEGMERPTEEDVFSFE